MTFVVQMNMDEVGDAIPEAAGGAEAGDKADSAAGIFALKLLENEF